MTVECFCNEWKVGMPQIIGVQEQALYRASVSEYTGGTFRYCPWCGEGLQNVGEKNKEIGELEKELADVDKEIRVLQKESAKLLKHAKKIKEESC